MMRIFAWDHPRNTNHCRSCDKLARDRRLPAVWSYGNGSDVTPRRIHCGSFGVLAGALDPLPEWSLQSVLAHWKLSQHARGGK